MKIKQPLLLGLFIICSAGASEKKTTETIWVGKSDDAKMCSPNESISLDAMGTKLKKTGVTILSKKKIHDSKMRIQQCDQDKGDLNGFLIPKTDLERAKQAGFLPVSKQ